MNPNDRFAIAARLMSEFARRTGLSPAGKPVRYLWTDAFAVCNFLELLAQTSDQKYRLYAEGLIEQVHYVLGRYRDDDERSGWISGLDERAGRRHPTTGGLRIGKPLRERTADEPLDERLEWDRDGQYFHYLTKWMHALCQAAVATNDFDYAVWAVELGQAAFKSFAQQSGSGRVVGVYWKMSTDLSRPLVPATGLHDALDGLITFREAQNSLANTPTTASETALSSAIESLSAICQNRDWTTTDPLGLGGLLFDAARLSQLLDEQSNGDIRLLEKLLDACWHGLKILLADRYLDRPVSHRLAFRELGLAIGLQALPLIAKALSRESRILLDRLLSYEVLSEKIVSVWLRHAQDRDETWRPHQDINDVMLATALVPGTFLTLGTQH
jgi:hypothetical protein